MSKPGRVVVLGSVNIDYVLHTPRIPVPGETIAGRDFRVVMGGKGANQAVACARAGGSCSLIACVGDDAYGREAVAGFIEDGIKTGGVTVIAGARTGAAMIFIDDSAENCIGISAEANAELTVARVEAQVELIAAADYLLLQLEVPLASVQRAAELARAAGTRVVLNPAPATGPLPADLLANVDLLTPNQTEARLLLGSEAPADNSDAAVAQALLRLGVAQVLMTQGADGVLFATGDDLQRVPAVAVQAVDTVGAGDCFNGVLVGELAAGVPMLAAIRFANAAAAIAVTRPGAQDAMPRRAEIAL